MFLLSSIPAHTCCGLIFIFIYFDASVRSKEINFSLNLKVTKNGKRAAFFANDALNMPGEKKKEKEEGQFIYTTYEKEN